MNLISTNQQAPSFNTLVEELEARLEAGDRMIRQLEAEGADTAALNRHWLSLLEEYKAAWHAQLEPVAA